MSLGTSPLGSVALGATSAEEAAATPANTRTSMTPSGMVIHQSVTRTMMMPDGTVVTFTSEAVPVVLLVSSLMMLGVGM